MGLFYPINISGELVNSDFRWICPFIFKACYGVLRRMIEKDLHPIMT